MTVSLSVFGIAALKKHVDSLVVIPNDRLKLLELDEPITLKNAFDMADNVLRQGVQCISNVINVPGVINLDFADVCAVMKDMGYAHMGVGKAVGKDKARVAATMAIDSPLLETKIDGAKGIILNIISCPDIDLNDIELAANMFKEAADPECNIIWGVAFDENMEDEMEITAIATGFADLAEDSSVKKEETKAEPVRVAIKEEKVVFSANKEKTETSSDIFKNWDPGFTASKTETNPAFVKTESVPQAKTEEPAAKTEKKDDQFKIDASAFDTNLTDFINMLQDRNARNSKSSAKKFDESDDYNNGWTNLEGK